MSFNPPASPARPDRDMMAYDVLIVGAGPSGLSCAIRLKQLALEKGLDISVCVLEKAAATGAHLLSGAVLEPRALDELLPSWRTDASVPAHVPVTSDAFYFMTEKKAYRLPTPPQMHNRGNFMISLGEFGAYLASQAESLGTEIYTGFPAAELLMNESGAVIGVATGDMGYAKDGSKTDAFTPGAEIYARQTIFAEGAHGHLTKQIIAKYRLRTENQFQTYGLGIKEVWEVDKTQHRQGHTMHTIGWPMDSKTYGGSWLYHMQDNKVSIGFVIGLDYTNPWISPFEEMQRFKTHPLIRPILTGGRRLSYGARALVEGGLQSIPKLTFPGGMLIGDAAGFLNVPKIKGNHAAMKSGILAAEALLPFLNTDPKSGDECTAYTDQFRSSWLYRELYRVRNIRPGFKYGLAAGLVHAAFQTVGGWMLPYTLAHHGPDYAVLTSAEATKKPSYLKPDGVLTFDRLSSVYLSNTNHRHDEPSHLRLVDPRVPVARNMPLYAEPATRYCPAGVYEVVMDAAGSPVFQINAQNCIHCKTCDIKDPAQNIIWTTPEGGGGPNYVGM